MLPGTARHHAAVSVVVGAAGPEAAANDPTAAQGTVPLVVSANSTAGPSAGTPPRRIGHAAFATAGPRNAMRLPAGEPNRAAATRRGELPAWPWHAPSGASASGLHRS